jgi:sensor histidine kinase YesM
VNARATLWRDLGVYAALWTVFGLLSATQEVVNALYVGHPVDWVRTYGTQLLNWWTCGLGTPIYIWLVRRFPLRGPRVWAIVGLYVAVILACIVLKYVVWVPLQNLIFHSDWSFETGVVTSVFGVFLDQFYFVILLYAVEYYRTARERELQASRLEAELSRSQLDALRSQLNPHFLFNTLNSISALMHHDVDAADEMLSRLAEMLRAGFDAGSEQEVTLRVELDVLHRYLEIMRVRFGDRLRTAVDVDESVLQERVPSFLLQPLVENIVRHGVDASRATTDVRITARADGLLLRIRVLDTGRGLPVDGAMREGVGLSNTRRRLERLYGTAGVLDVQPRDGGGTEVTIAIPRRLGLVAAGQVTA